MSAIATFLIGVGVVLIGAFTVVIYLQPHLRRILRDLCGTEERANFWTAFSNIVLVLTPIIFALSSRPAGGGGTEVFFDISAQVRWGLIGLIGAVVLLGFALGQYIPRESHQSDKAAQPTA